MTAKPMVTGQRPINVIHIASGDLWAGAEVQLYQLAKELNKNALINLSVVLLNHGMLEEKLKTEGVSVTVFDEKAMSGLRILKKLCAHFRKSSPDIVHTHRQKENILGSLAARFCGRTKTLRTVHGAPESHAAFLRVDKHLFRYADWLIGRFVQNRIVAVSEELGGQLASRFPQAKIHVIENGIDIGELQSAASVPVVLPGPADAVNISIIGRLVAVKRVDVFLQAARILKERNDRPYAFYIFGDGPLRPVVTGLIDELTLNDQVFMLGFKENISAYLSKMNFLLITSDHEGLPMILLEALGLRIPVIAHAVGGIPSVLEHGKCGTLVERQAPVEYANAIEDCLADKERLSASVQHGYERLKRQYAVGYTASRYFQLYLGMLA